METPSSLWVAQIEGESLDYGLAPLLISYKQMTLLEKMDKKDTSKSETKLIGDTPKCVFRIIPLFWIHKMIKHIKPEYAKLRISEVFFINYLKISLKNKGKH